MGNKDALLLRWGGCSRFRLKKSFVRKSNSYIELYFNPERFHVPHRTLLIFLDDPGLYIVRYSISNLKMTILRYPRERKVENRNVILRILTDTHPERHQNSDTTCTWHYYGCFFFYSPHSDFVNNEGTWYWLNKYTEPTNERVTERENGPTTEWINKWTWPYLCVDPRCRTGQKKICLQWDLRTCTKDMSRVGISSRPRNALAYKLDSAVKIRGKPYCWLLSREPVVDKLLRDPRICIITSAGRIRSPVNSNLVHAEWQGVYLVLAASVGLLRVDRCLATPWKSFRNRHRKRCVYFVSNYKKNTDINLYCCWCICLIHVLVKKWILTGVAVSEKQRYSPKYKEISNMPTKGNSNPD